MNEWLIDWLIEWLNDWLSQGMNEQVLLVGVRWWLVLCVVLTLCWWWDVAVVVGGAENDIKKKQNKTNKKQKTKNSHIKSENQNTIVLRTFHKETPAPPRVNKIHKSQITNQVVQHCCN